MEDEDEGCHHLQEVARHDRRAVTPTGPGCQDCLATGSRWVQLRLCLTCGHVGCCDSSPNRHATAHYRSTGHPVVRSFEPHEAWAYCYVDDATLDEIPALEGEARDPDYVPGAGAP